MRRVWFALLLYGCSGDLPPVGVVDKLRLLAVRAEPAEPGVGESVALDALFVEPLVRKDDAGARAPTIVWTICPTVPNASGTAAPCDPSMAAPIATTFAPQTAGDFTLTIAVGDGVDAIVAVKRLHVRGSGETGAPNHNPALAAFTLADAPLDADAGFAPSPPKMRDKLQLTAVAAADALEPGETLTVAWFTTAGTIDASRTAVDAASLAARANWSAPTAGELAAAAPSDGSVDFWAVLRDDRGGVSWLSGRARP